MNALNHEISCKCIIDAMAGVYETVTIGKLHCCLSVEFFFFQRFQINFTYFLERTNTFKFVGTINFVLITTYGTFRVEL